MALWEGISEKLGKSWSTNLLIGVAAVVLAPIVIPAVVAAMRPLAKTAVKGGILIYDKAGEMFAEVGEQMSDLVAEARAEMAASAAAASAAAAAAQPESVTPQADAEESGPAY